MPSATTSLTLRSDLIDEATKLGGHATPTAATEAALDAYVKHLRRLDVVNSFGTFDLVDDAEFKAMRRNRSEKRQYP